jgi:inner membrane protein
MALVSLNPLLARVLVIGALVLVLLVPLSQVENLVRERSGMRDAAEASIAQIFGAEQTIGGPILSIPIDAPVKVADEVRIERTWHRLLPDQLTLTGDLTPDRRHRGIYQVNVYTARMTLRAAFPAVRLAELVASSAKDAVVAWDEARLTIPVADPRGIREISLAQWNGRPLRLLPSSYADLSGIGALVETRSDPPAAQHVLELDMVIAGTAQLQFLPMAATTKVTLRSSWPHPSFAGAFAPIEPQVSAQGFDARWQVLEINRPVPQSWRDASVSATTLLGSAFGVSLYQPVDTYQRNYRAIRYAILFIALTFLSFFVWEHTAGAREGAARLHPMHYLLIGLALATFYLLLVALSEHLSFALAYAAAASALVALLGVYLASVMRRIAAGATAAAGIAAVYGALYLLVLSEEYALLIGALMLFAALAVLMLATRRVDWHAISSSRASSPESAR